LNLSKINPFKSQPIILKIKNKMQSRPLVVSNESSYDAFLEAPVGEQSNGMSVSVFSALARFGVDPRREAERLARLSTTAAAASLESMIDQVSGGHWIALDAKGAAKRTIALLPIPRAKILEASDGTPTGVVPSRRNPVWLWIAAVALAAAVLYAALPNENSLFKAPAFYSPSWTGESVP
jgi:hypothetical protein